jgi:preprotein translocase subunit SecG
MSTLVTVIHLITCVLISIVVLLQSGKGAEISASFGGSSQTVFGSSGGANFFTRLTLTLAGIFMATSLTLTWMGTKSKKSVFDGMTAPISAAPVGAPGDTSTTAPAAAASAASAEKTAEKTTEKK